MITRDVAKNVTAIVATYEREEMLAETISSFRRAYPNLPFVVADNSVNKYPRKDVNYIELEPGSGISKSRNAALERVRTPYTLLLDDDHERMESSKVEDLLEHLGANKFDIVAGNQVEKFDEPFDFHGAYEIEGQVLFHFIGASSGSLNGAERFDVTPNFFVAKTEVVKALAWDSELKFAKEHDDFFLRAKAEDVKVGFRSDIEVLNASKRKHHGGNRAHNCEEHFFSKWGVEDKVEVRWIKTPYPRLSFYSTRMKESFEPTKELFEKACYVFSRMDKEFEVLNPFADESGSSAAPAGRSLRGGF
jgi:glycosyltransferase involved in cell wall biosynthesis